MCFAHWVPLGVYFSLSLHDWGNVLDSEGVWLDFDRIQVGICSSMDTSNVEVHASKLKQRKERLKENPRWKAGLLIPCSFFPGHLLFPSPAPRVARGRQGGWEAGAGLLLSLDGCLSLGMCHCQKNNPSPPLKQPGVAGGCLLGLLRLAREEMLPWCFCQGCFSVQEQPSPCSPFLLPLFFISIPESLPFSPVLPLLASFPTLHPLLSGFWFFQPPTQPGSWQRLSLLAKLPLLLPCSPKGLRETMWEKGASKCSSFLLALYYLTVRVGEQAKFPTRTAQDTQCIWKNNNGTETSPIVIPKGTGWFSLKDMKFFCNVWTYFKNDDDHIGFW